MIYPATIESIQRAAKILRDGGLVAFPTETVYGLGANAENARAVEKIFSVKGRPHFNPLIVHLYSIDQLESVAFLEQDTSLKSKIERLKFFWPGPLSLVLPKQPWILDSVCAGLTSVAVRIPGHPIALSLLQASGVPVAAPSANMFGMVSPTTAAHVEDGLGDQADMILDGGPCTVGLESTVLSLIDEIPAVLRPGAVTVEQLREVLGEVTVKSRARDSSQGPVTSPGMLHAHYSPRTKLVLRDQIDVKRYPPRVGLITFNRTEDVTTEFDYIRVSCLSTSGDLQEVASRLFAALRELDTLGLDLIVVDKCREAGLGLAIMDRLRKASAAFKP